MKISFFGFVSLLVLITSCTVYKEYPIEVYKPGEANVSPSAKKVAIVYRNFKYEKDTLQHYQRNNFRLEKVKNDPENLDSMLVTTCLNKLAAELKNNQAFEEVFILPVNVFERHTGDHLTDLPPEITDNIAKTTGADLLIMLETFSSFFTTIPRSYDQRTSDDVTNITIWGVYDPVKQQNIDRKTMIDTVYWHGYDEKGYYRKGYVPPPRLAALEMASEMAGEDYARRFYSSWQTVNRMYSVPPLPDFSEAARYFVERKPDRAIALWQKYADDSNGKMAINARYNLALAYELKDDLETAQKWLIAAFHLASRFRNKQDLQMILTYKKVLDDRQKLIRQNNNRQNENNP